MTTREPRLGSATISLDRYCREVYATTADQWRQLPIQWRGFVLFHQQFMHTVDATLEMLKRSGLSMKLSPQGVYDAFQGHAPE